LLITGLYLKVKLYTTYRVTLYTNSALAGQRKLPVCPPSSKWVPG